MAQRLRRLVWFLVVLALVYAGLSVAAAEFLSRGGKKDVVMPKTLDEFEITSSDNVRIMATLRHNKQSQAIVCLFHGRGGTRDPRWMETVASWGYNVLAIDFRAHGESEGSRCSFGWHERHDVEAALAYVRKRWPDFNVGVWGRSLGAAAICYAHESTKNCKAIVLEQCYSSIAQALEARLDQYLPGAFHWLSKGPEYVVAKWVGIDYGAMRPIDRLQHFQADTLLFSTGADDPVAGPDEIQRLLAPLPKAEQRIVPGRAHVPLWSDEDYAGYVRSFLGRRLL